MSATGGEKYRKKNRIGVQFNARPIEMMESPAYRVLSRAARMVIDRVCIELAHHGGNDNGKLIVTYDQFADYGLHRAMAASGIREACALGLLEVPQQGRRGAGQYRYANEFLIPWAPCNSRTIAELTHPWRKFQTMEAAQEIAEAARKAVKRTSRARKPARRTLRPRSGRGREIIN
jgi:hypothetical protein